MSASSKSRSAAVAKPNRRTPARAAAFENSDAPHAIAEQTRIVAEVERRLSVVEELEAVVSANLERAFTGKLLTADGADNTDKE